MCTARYNTASTPTLLILPHGVRPANRKLQINVLTRFPDYWCQQQTTQCPLICLQGKDVSSDAPTSNTCDPEALAYSCICSNGKSPNMTEYSQTLPYFVCTEWGTQCVNGCGQDSTCQTACRVKHPCGAQGPARVNTSTISTMTATASPTGSGVLYTGLSSSPQAQDSGASSKVLHIGQAYGGIVLAATLFGSLALLV